MVKGKGIMLQGTASDVGKTILCTALCRILKEDGYRVAPFKAQNMTLNSYVTVDGHEMGTAQVLQAQAAGVLPRVEMNPILLKPKADMEAQVVVLGKPLKDMTAKGYRREYLPKARQVVRDCLVKLQEEYEVLVAEGAGSAAEVNLRDGDIVNMAVAEMADLPVVLVADIDRGGVFASIVGTLELLTPEERERVVGLIINKFRGDPDLFRSGIDFLEERTGRPVLGVIPYLEHGIAEEDSASISRRRCQTGALELAVLQLPRIANFGDVHPLAHLPGMTLRYVRRGETIGRPAAVIVPDTTDPLGDLAYLQENGYQAELVRLAGDGVPILGIGAGCYLLGKRITGKDGSERQGLNLLDCHASLTGKPLAGRVTGRVTGARGDWWQDLAGTEIQGYFLRPGQLQLGAGTTVWLELEDGPVLFGSPGEKVLGTELHELFQNTGVLLAWVNGMRRDQGLNPLTAGELPYHNQEQSFDRLAAEVRKHLNLKLLYQLMGLSPGDA